MSRRRDTKVRGRRGTVALVVAVVLGAGGSGSIAWAATHQASAPQPSAAAAGVIDVATPSAGASGTSSSGASSSGASSSGASSSGASSSGAPDASNPGTPNRAGTASAAPSTGAGAATATATPAVRGPVLPRSVPTEVVIPAIHVRSSLQRLGLTAAGQLAVPQPGPHYNEAAWFTGSPTPGQLGPAVIEGHVDSAAEGPSVFFRLGALRPGDQVDVRRADGTTAVFEVNAVRRYPKDAFPTALVYANTDHAALRLITCGGSFDSASGHYRDDIVVFAHLTGSR